MKRTYVFTALMASATLFIAYPTTAQAEEDHDAHVEYLMADESDDAMDAAYEAYDDTEMTSDEAEAEDDEDTDEIAEEYDEDDYDEDEDEDEDE